MGKKILQNLKITKQGKMHRSKKSFREKKYILPIKEDENLWSENESNGEPFLIRVMNKTGPSYQWPYFLGWITRLPPSPVGGLLDSHLHFQVEQEENINDFFHHLWGYKSHNLTPTISCPCFGTRFFNNKILLFVRFFFLRHVWIYLEQNVKSKVYGK